MRLDRWIILVLLVALGAVGLYYVASQLGIRFAVKTGPSIQFVLPTASGITVGQAITVAGRPTADDAGQVSEILPTADGVLITVTLHGGMALPVDARMRLRPGTPPKPSTLELAGGTGTVNAAAGSITKIPAELELGPPEGLVEPVPEWPLEAP